MSHIFFLEPGGAKACTPLQAVSPETSKTPLIGCVSSGSTLDSDRTDCLNLTAWFSYHVVSFQLHTSSTGLPQRTATPLFTNHKVTACQSTRGHQERTRNPCQLSLYNNRSKFELQKNYIVLWGKVRISLFSRLCDK